MVQWGELLEVSSLDFVLLALLAVLVYRWWRRKNEPEFVPPPRIPPLPKQDLTLAGLRKYDGVQDQHILFAVDGTIFDVTRGKTFYGPEGPYGKLAGHDATRALATMDAKAVKELEWDDVSDLKEDEVETMQEWKSSFKYKYYTVGKLIRDGETPADYGGEISKIDA